MPQVLRRLSHVRRAEEHPHWATEERDVRLAALQALQLIAPLGHDKTTRMVVGVLRQSWERLLRDFTGCARDALRPHRGSISDYGESRGPINLRTQLQAIAKEGAMNCPAKCCEAASEVRMAAIQVRPRHSSPRPIPETLDMSPQALSPRPPTPGVGH